MLITTEASTERPVTLAEAKAQCSAVEFDSDDALIQIYLDAAIDHAETQTGRFLTPRRLQLRLDGWPTYDLFADPAPRPGQWLSLTDLDLPAFPLRDVVEVTYIDLDDAEQAIGAGDWTWETTDAGGVVRFRRAFCRPRLSIDRKFPLRVTLDAGHDLPDATGADPQLALPARARTLILMLTAHWYRVREPVVVENGHYTVATVPLGAEMLIQSLQVIR